MKGVFISQQLEFKVEVAGDAFSQGDTLPCTFSVKNHGAAAISVPDIFLQLAVGDLKKVKEKAPDAFAVLSSAECPAPGSIPAKEVKSCTASITLDKNCPISEKSQSIHLLFGSEALPGARGQVLVTVNPHTYINSVLEIFESSFQFVRKGEKSAHDWVVAKLKPPAAQRFASVEELLLSLQFDQSALLLKYLFKIKKFVASESATMSIGKGKVEVTQRLEPSRYLMGGEFINHPAIEDEINAAIGQVATTM